MTTRNVQRYRSAAAADCSTVERLTQGLGWFSIGLGLAEIFAPGAVSALIGVRDGTKARTILRLYGLRELAAGIGIFSQPRPAGWLWARVAGDAVDLTTLLNALGGRGNDTGRVAFGITSVVGVTIADVYCARALDEQRRQSGESREDTRVARYMKPLLERVQRGEIDPSMVITHHMPLDDAPRGYSMFRNKEDNCEKVVLKPN